MGRLPSELKVDADELALLAAYDRLEPIGAIRDDWHAALLANTIARCHGNRTKLGDFILHFGTPEPPRQQTQAEMLAVFKRLADLQNRAKRSPQTLSLRRGKSDRR